MSDDIEAQIKARAEEMYIEHAARTTLAARIAVPDVRPQPETGLLSELLVDAGDLRWRIDGVLPSHGRMLLVAARKLGKTTITGNMARALLTGEPFLGTFPVNPLDGRVVALNYEVTPSQYAAWMAEIGVPADRLFVINMRGRRNLLADEAGREELASLIKVNEGQVVIVDPFGRAFSGASQNDTTDVTAWLSALDQAVEQSKAEELILSAHAGWEGTRTRGSSGLEDWPDAVVTVTGSPTGDRFLSAFGRDVEVAEDTLAYDSETRALTLTGGGSKALAAERRSIEELLPRVLKAIGENPGAIGAKLDKLIPGQRSGLVSKTAKHAESIGKVRREPGKQGAVHHYLEDLPGTR